MKRILAIFLASAFIAGAIPGLSWALGDPEYRRMLETSAAFKAADQELSQRWKTLMGELKGDEKKRIRADQREWLKNEVDAQAQEYMAQGLGKAEAYAKVYHRRANVLRAIYENSLLPPDRPGSAKADDFYNDDEDAERIQEKADKALVEDALTANKDAQETASVGSDDEMATIIPVISAYEAVRKAKADRSRFESDFKGMRIAISGKVASVSEKDGKYIVDISGSPDGDPFVFISCAFNPSAKKAVSPLKKGDKVTIAGDYEGEQSFDMAIINLVNCELE